MKVSLVPKPQKYHHYLTRLDSMNPSRTSRNQSAPHVIFQSKIQNPTTQNAQIVRKTTTSTVIFRLLQPLQTKPGSAIDVLKNLQLRKNLNTVVCWRRSMMKIERLTAFRVIAKLFTKRLKE